MQTKTIAKIKKMFTNNELTKQDIESLREDGRKGVQNLLRIYDRKKKHQLELKNQFNKMWTFENTLSEKGFQFIAGVDEAGRGPLAGPVVAAAVILPRNFNLIGVTDSKQLSEEKRNYYFQKITEEAQSYAIASVSNERIDEVNIYQATIEAMRQAVMKLTIQPDFTLLDAIEIEELPMQTKSLIKGDERSVSIAAASILAKVSRDRTMREIAYRYPEYGFEKHMGYGTKYHLQQLKAYGLTPYHRKSFSPVRKLLLS